MTCLQSLVTGAGDGGLDQNEAVQPALLAWDRWSFLCALGRHAWMNEKSGQREDKTGSDQHKNITFKTTEFS